MLIMVTSDDGEGVPVGTDTSSRIADLKQHDGDEHTNTTGWCCRRELMGEDRVRRFEGTEYLYVWTSSPYIHQFSHPLLLLPLLLL